MSERRANPERGEVEITLGGRIMILRPSFERLVEMERTTGLGLLVIARRIASGQYGIGEMAAVIAAGLKGSGEPATVEKVGELLLAEGLSGFADPVNQFLINAITGGARPKDPDPGEAAAAAGMPN